MLEDVKEMVRSIIKRGWAAIISVPGQSVASATTFTVSAANHYPDDLLTNIGIIAGIGVSVTLIIVNLIRAIKDILTISREWKSDSKGKKKGLL